MQFLKQFLTVIGFLLPEPVIRLAVSTANYLAIGRWMRRHSLALPPRVDSKEAVWRHVASQLRDQRILYLEFGVYQGASIRWWSKALAHPDSHLHGFDSFEGLPESGGPWEKGQFNRQGLPPDIGDPRVRFFAGWFSQTLQTYSPPEHDVLVMNLDADLYSSTAEVLAAATPWIREGTFVYFDEFNHIDHEPRAFSEFLASTNARFASECADRTLNHVVFRCLRRPHASTNAS